MQLLGYESCKADPDISIRAAVKDNDEKYYEYMLLYLDDALAVSKHPIEALLEIDKYFMMKPESIEVPKVYLGAKLSLVELLNGAKVWSLSSSKYINYQIANVERKMLLKS